MAQTKCMNILKAVIQQKGFLSSCGQQFEQICLPVLALMQNPDKIQFEDDICALIKQMIRKSRTVSPTMLQVLPYLEQTFMKNK